MTAPQFLQAAGHGDEAEIVQVVGGALVPSSVPGQAVHQDVGGLPDSEVGIVDHVRAVGSPVGMVIENQRQGQGGRLMVALVPPDPLRLDRRASPIAAVGLDVVAQLPPVFHHQTVVPDETDQRRVVVEVIVERVVDVRQRLQREALPDTVGDQPSVLPGVVGMAVVPGTEIGAVEAVLQGRVVPLPSVVRVDRGQAGEQNGSLVRVATISGQEIGLRQAPERGNDDRAVDHVAVLAEREVADPLHEEAVAVVRVRPGAQVSLIVAIAGVPLPADRALDLVRVADRVEAPGAVWIDPPDLFAMPGATGDRFPGMERIPRGRWETRQPARPRSAGSSTWLSRGPRTTLSFASPASGARGKEA